MLTNSSPWPFLECVLWGCGVWRFLDGRMPDVPFIKVLFFITLSVLPGMTLDVTLRRQQTSPKNQTKSMSTETKGRGGGRGGGGRGGGGGGRGGAGNSKKESILELAKVRASVVAVI
jgi:hypothetical protein